MNEYIVQGQELSGWLGSSTDLMRLAGTEASGARLQQAGLRRAVRRH